MAYDSRDINSDIFTIRTTKMIELLTSAAVTGIIKALTEQITFWL